MSWASTTGIITTTTELRPRSLRPTRRPCSSGSCPFLSFSLAVVVILRGGGLTTGKAGAGVELEADGTAVALDPGAEGGEVVARVLAADHQTAAVAAHDRVGSLRVIALHLRIPGRRAGHDLDAGPLTRADQRVARHQRAGILDHDALGFLQPIVRDEVALTVTVGDVVAVDELVAAEGVAGALEAQRLAGAGGEVHAAIVHDAGSSLLVRIARRFADHHSVAGPGQAVVNIVAVDIGIRGIGADRNRLAFEAADVVALDNAVHATGAEAVAGEPAVREQGPGSEPDECPPRRQAHRDPRNRRSPPDGERKTAR